VIHVEELKKRYGDFEAVKGVSFDVAPGEVFGFLGPNGAGKTTTMRMMAGLLRPTSGQVRIGGHDLLEDPESAKRITGFIPDRPYLYEKLTAFEFLEFVAGLHQMKNSDVASRARMLLGTFGLERWADGLVENFSHGMKQRLVFAAALLPRPKLLVVDEPMVGLDPRGMKLVKKVFRDLCASKALTVFVSTHTLEVAEEVCDRIAIIHQGQIVALGTMASLREQAGKDGGRLEDIFLQLTEENASDAEPDVDVDQLLAPAS
jgi:ABC-2 type transport system ATP-binding protein